VGHRGLAVLGCRIALVAASSPGEEDQVPVGGGGRVGLGPCSLLVTLAARGGPAAGPNNADLGADFGQDEGLFPGGSGCRVE